MNWPAVYPELVLLTMGCAVALIDLFVTDERHTVTYWVTQLSLAVVAAMHLGAFNSGATQYAMQGLMVADPMSHLLAFCAVIAVIVTLVYARPYAADRGMLKGELFSLSLFSLLGVLVMVSANNFLVIYLGLELMSLSLYALTAFRRDHLASTEAAMKFFVLGALSSGFLLYGLSMMYGATGSLDIGEVFQAIGTGQINRPVLLFGTVFVVAALGFKLAAAPFHMWVPDVYHGAPTAVTLLISTAPKLAAFAITIRLLVEGMLGLAADWQQMLIVLSIASMTLGNIAAIAQSNLKRMLAYSTIGQMGFVLLGLLSGVVEGDAVPAANAYNAYSAALFYMLAYVLTTLGTFGIITMLAREGFESEEIADLAGLNQRSAWLAAVMAIFMLSLIGMPPTIGFYAKLSVLQALISTSEPGLIALAVYAVVMSLVSAFYYLRVIKVMYFDEPVDRAPIPHHGDVRAVMSVNGVAVLALGLLPGGLMAWCAQAIVKTLGT